MTGAGPAGAEERIRTLDIVRGAAVFGLLLSNMELFSAPLAALALPSLRSFGNPVDAAAHALRTFAVDLKFISIFALLFGVGIALRERRWRDRAVPFGPVYGRWLLALGAIGLLHGALIWYGDILLAYALTGVLAAWALRLGSRALLLTALGLLALNGLVAAAGAVIGPGAAFPAGAGPGDVEAALGRLFQRETSVYSSGSWLSVASLRLWMFSRCVPIFLSAFGARLLGLFLLGIWAVRAGVLEGLAERPSPLYRAGRWGLLAGLPLEALAAGLQALGWTDGRGLGLIWASHYFGSLGLSLAYLAALWAAGAHPFWRERLQSLAGVGRTSLSNYVLQSVICTAIFYPYGLGLYGKLGPASGLALACLIFPAQCLLSAWWLKRFRFGPLEGLARAWTYGGGFLQGVSMFPGAPRFLGAVVGGALLALSIMPLGLGWLSLLALVPFLWVTQDRSPAGAFLWGWLYGAAAFLTGLAWFFPVLLRVMDLGPIGLCAAFAGLCLAHGLMFAVGGWATRMLVALLSRRLGVEPDDGPVLAAIPVFVLADSYFPQYLPAHLANAWVGHLPMVQSLELFGMAGIAWLVAGFNVALYIGLRGLARRRKEPSAPLRWRPLAAAAALLLANEVYGFVRMRQVDALVGRVLPAQRLRAGVIQGSVPKDERFVPAFFRRNLGVYGELSGKALESGPLDLVVWPHATYPWFVEFPAGDEELRRPSVGGLPFEEAFRRDMPVRTQYLVGARSLVWRRLPGAGEKEVYRKHVVSLLASSSGSFMGVTAKRNLTPFSEFMPLERTFRQVNRLKPRNFERFWRGPRRVLSLEDGTRIGAYVCYEELLAGPARWYVRSGAQILVAITADDQERDTAGLELHLLASSLRAIENRKYLLRAATSGISAVVDPAGRIVRRLGPGERGFLQAEVARLDGATPQAVLGPLAEMSGAFILAAALLWALRRRTDAPIV